MREIKFRAWDKDNHRMREVCSMDTDNGDYDTGRKRRVQIWDHPSVRAAQIKGHVTSLFLENVELMQYTGLKDKNGADIYEGDILRFDEKEWGNKHTFAIGWDERHGRFSGDGVPHDWSEWCEVIGNIYETPKLIQPTEKQP